MSRANSDLGAVQVVHADRLDRVEELTKTSVEKLTELQLKHERAIAVLTEKLAASKSENATLRALIERVDHRFWALLSTTAFIVLFGLVAVLVAVIEK